MDNKRTLILTGSTDNLRHPNEIDNTYEEVFELTLPSIQKYVKKYNYDLLTIRSFGSDNSNMFENKHIGFLRMMRAFQMLDYYDVVMWIDSDSIITNFNYSINDFHIDDTHCFYASWDWANTTTFSTGNFIIQKNKYTENLYKEFLNVSKFIILNNISGQEQTALNLIYQNTSLRDVIKILDHKYLGGVPSKMMFNGIWGDRSDPPFPWDSDSFLVHLTGITNRDRIEMCMKQFYEYL